MSIYPADREIPICGQSAPVYTKFAAKQPVTKFLSWKLLSMCEEGRSAYAWK